MWPACRYSSDPAGVGREPVVSRKKRRAPQRRSIAASRALADGWVMPRARAAPPTDPDSTTARTSRRSSTLGAPLIGQGYDRSTLIPLYRWAAPSAQAGRMTTHSSPTSVRPPSLDPADARAWIASWDAQQATFFTDREERFAVVVDVLETVLGRPDPLVVDLGCGPGSLAARIHDRLPGAAVVGADMDPLLLGLARAA